MKLVKYLSVILITFMVTACGGPRAGDVIAEVNFRSGSYQLDKEARMIIADAVDKYWKRHSLRRDNNFHDYKRMRFYLEGYTDSVGDFNYNKRLSHNRVKAVRNELMDHGVHEDMILYEAHSERRQKVKTRDNVNKRANRRVTIRYLH